MTRVAGETRAAIAQLVLRHGEDAVSSHLPGEPSGAAPDAVVEQSLAEVVSAHLLASFEALFPMLRDGGLVFDDPATSVGFLKQLVDGLNHEDIERRRPRSTDATIGGLHFYHNLCFIEKATNLDGRPPAWISRS
ncbi:hypothetical protein [Amycolatopsis sp. cmx-11-12]|uniref:hypothetical protein n=1 Tax=Amycolatopsis sp. cmx-11-12 TaxID=2785795 RepID=UPI003916FA44